MTESLTAAGPVSRPRRRRAPQSTARRRWHRVALVVLLLTVPIALGAVYLLQGYRIYVVHTGSMEPTYRPGDLVIDRPASAVHPGEVITFRHSDLTTDVVTHRVTAITPAGLIHTKGDANRSADVWEIRPDQVQGRVAAHLRGFGYVAVYFQHPAGIGSLVTAVIAIVILWGIFFPGEAEARSAGRPKVPAS